MTEKSRLAIAAAAMRHRIVNRRRPLVFLPVIPRKNGSAVVAIVETLIYSNVVGLADDEVYLVPNLKLDAADRGSQASPLCGNGSYQTQE
jgi:hypothetical protein